MERLPDWQPRLTVWLRDSRKKPFEQGTWDCGVFAAGAIEAMTGVDVIAEVRGKYSTTKGAMKLLKRLGYKDHVALFASVCPKIPLLSSRAGDLVAFKTAEGLALGIVQGAGAYHAGPHGLAIISTQVAHAAYRVG